MAPWSVMANAGMPRAATVSISVTADESAGAVIREAPSSRENSVCVCRWTKLEAPLPIPPNVPRPSDVSVEIVWKSHTPVIPDRTLSRPPRGVQRPHQVLGQRLLQLDRLTADRMTEPEPPGVKERPVEAEPAGVVAAPPVGPISDDLVTDRAEVHPDLMSPSRPGPGPQQGCPR